MTSKRAQQIVCVRCCQDVKGPVRGLYGGVKIHGGHVDVKLDKSCGVWGWRPARKSERED